MKSPDNRKDMMNKPIPTAMPLHGRYVKGLRGGKFRLDRGPLRWWLIVVGVFMVSFEPVRFAIGAALVVVGGLLHFICKCYLRQQKALTVAGPYRFTRNPFYLANLIIDGGLLVLIGNVWIAGAFAIAWFWVYRKTILTEEANLTRLFGNDYLDYCRKVPRMLPRPWRYMPRIKVHGPLFSLKNPNILGGKEIERSLRIISYPLLLFVAASVNNWWFGAADDVGLSAVLAAAGFLVLNFAGLISTWLMRPIKIKRKDATRRTALSRVEKGRIELCELEQTCLIS